MLQISYKTTLLLEGRNRWRPVGKVTLAQKLKTFGLPSNLVRSGKKLKSFDLNFLQKEATIKATTSTILALKKRVASFESEIRLLSKANKAIFECLLPSQKVLMSFKQ